MVNDVKRLLNLMGISYIHPDVGEGEAYASELCRMGYVDYVLTEKTWIQWHMLVLN